MRLLPYAGFAILGGLWAGGLQLQGQDSLQYSYQKLQAQLEKENKPINKGRIIIKLADWELNRAKMHMVLEELESANQALIRFRDWIREAREIFRQEYEKAPKKNSNVYRTCELTLHRQIRQLESFKSSFGYDQQEVLLQAIDAARTTQEELLVYLFGEENVRGKKETLEGESGQKEAGPTK